MDINGSFIVGGCLFVLFIIIKFILDKNRN